MQLTPRLFASFWVPLLCSATRHAKSSGLRGRGYPLDSPATDATWLPVEEEVDESLADTKDEIGTAKKELAYVKDYCNGKNHGRCKKEVERMSARLDRLIAAEKQLRAKESNATKVEDGVRNVSESVVELESQVDSLHAVKKFAELSKADFDNQYERLSQASDEYQKKMDGAQSQIDALKEDLKRSRRSHYDAEQVSLNLIAKAKGIERGVETTDLFADAQFAKAVRKQRVAETLYARADAIREHAEKMMVLHHNENKSEVKEVMYGTAHRLITEDQGIVNFGHMSDFGGELPHEDKKGKPCKKVKKVKEDEDEDVDDQADDNPNAPAEEDNSNAPASEDSSEEVMPAAEVVVNSPSEDQSISTKADGWKEVEMKDANTHQDQWVALHHHHSSKKQVKHTGSAKKRMVNHGNQKKVSEPKAPAVASPKADERFEKVNQLWYQARLEEKQRLEKIRKAKAEAKTEQQAEVPEAPKPLVIDDDEPQPVEDDESGGDDEAIDAVLTPSAEEQSTTVVTTTVAAVSVGTQADSLNAIASEDSSIDEDSPEFAEDEVADDTSNMDEAERQFKEAEEAEKALG